MKLLVRTSCPHCKLTGPFQVNEDTHAPEGKCARCGKDFNGLRDSGKDGWLSGLLTFMLGACFSALGVTVYDRMAVHVADFYRVRTLGEPVQEWTSRGPIEYAKPGVYRFVNHQTGEDVWLQGAFVLESLDPRDVVDSVERENR